MVKFVDKAGDVILELKDEDSRPVAVICCKCGHQLLQIYNSKRDTWRYSKCPYCHHEHTNESNESA